MKSLNENDLMKICPKCGSIHVNWIAGGIAGTVFKCEDCYYVGPFILEVKPKDLEKFQKEIRETGESGSL